MKIILNDLHWMIKGYWPYTPFLGSGLELGNELMGVTDWIAASVPGGIHQDLYKAGLIEDPYYEQNSLKCEWVENRWWQYKASFEVDREAVGRRIRLVFKGVDYKAHFYLNHQKLGEHEGMYDPVIFEITDILRFEGSNELSVLIEAPPEEMAQIGYTSRTKTQKSRFNYKWDFGTRMVNIGLWDDVLLEISGSERLMDTHICTHTADKTGLIDLSTTIEGIQGENASIKLTLTDPEGHDIASWSEEIVFTADQVPLHKQFKIPQPELWYPNGYGDQPLYSLRLQVVKRQQLSDEQEFQIGIRDLEVQKNVGSPVDAAPYTFVINGVPVYIKGVNLTPFDHVYGSITEKTYERYIARLKRANVNLVRIWGGGIIEKEYFYHLCDVNGILIWQEFIQSSSGIDNVPSEDPHFLRLLRTTAIHAVKTKRNHVCHTVWSGGNELMDIHGVPAVEDHPNLKMLKEIVNTFDPGKLFLATSALGPNEFLNIEQRGKNYDVHGSWKYGGVEKHYQLYNASDSLFHSEFGVDGCSSINSLKKFLGQEHLKIASMKQDMVWRHHGEWWDTLERDRTIFGMFTSLEQFIKASQFIQAEGLRYILEANRRRQFQNSGSVVWQFNEPWPNVSNTCIVDYYGTPKMAYYWLKNAYAPVHASLAYDKLFYLPEEEFHGKIFICSHAAEQTLTIKCEVLDATGKKLYTQTFIEHVVSNCVADGKGFMVKLQEQYMGVFFVRLTVTNAKGQIIDSNLYTFSQSDKNIFSNLLKLASGNLQIKRGRNGYNLKNTGNEVCLFIHGMGQEVENNAAAKQNYITLFPGEETEFAMEDLHTGAITHEIEMEFDWLNKK